MPDNLKRNGKHIMMSVSKRFFTKSVIDDENPETSYLYQTKKDGVDFSERLAEYKRGDFSFVGIRASVCLDIPHGGYTIIQVVESPGVWGVESDSDSDYITSLYDDECNVLVSMLETMGIEVVD